MSAIKDFLSKCSNIKSLADGGQKRVFSAVHPNYKDIVIKYGKYGVVSGLERISREVTLLGELESHYYPKQFEFIVEPLSSEFLIVEEKLNAVELSDVTGKFSTDGEILELLIELVTALDILWSRNVVHRDLKPQNILITPDCKPRIIDLGIARFLDEASLTKTIAVMGPATPMYAAPEQLENRKNSINHRSDFFNLGILTGALMLGHHPFDPKFLNNQSSFVENIITGRYVVPDSSRSEILNIFVKTSLEVKPYRRFRTPRCLKKHLGMET